VAPGACGMHCNGHMTFRAVIEFDPETQSYSAVCPELPGCASAGETEAAARKNIEEAIRLYLEPFPLTLSGDAKLFEVRVA
jgi:predicted RNase H-like HicB family nuclease